MLPDKMLPRHSRYGICFFFRQLIVHYMLTLVTLQDVGHSDEARELLVGLLVGNLKTSVCPSQTSSAYERR